jgi:hypothetical protein
MMDHVMVHYIFIFDRAVFKSGMQWTVTIAMIRRGTSIA